MGNFVSNSDANALMSEIGKKKLTVTDVMPLAASAANEGIPYLYLGTTTQDFTNGSIYECQEVTPATDPKTYEWVEKLQTQVDLTYYKRIWGGTEAGWEALTDEQKAQYEYTFFDGDSDYTLDVVDAVTDGDMRPVTSNAVADEVDDLDAEIADIVNIYSAKNMFPYPYYQTTQKVANVDVTDNGDGTITVDGTANATAVIFRYYKNDLTVNIPLESKKYKVSFEVDNIWGNSFHFGDMRLIKQDDSTYTYGEVIRDFIIDNTSGIYKGIETMAIYIAANTVVDNVTIKPMLRLESIEDDTWVPYAMTNKQLTESKMSYADNGILGAKNLFELKLTTQTSHGVTATVNNDGTIVANGTNDGTASWFWLKSTEKFKLNIPSGKYLVSGSPEGTSTSSYCLKFYDEGDGSATLKSYMIKNGEDVLVDIDNTHYYAFYLWVGQNQSPSNVTFKPMIRLATDADDTYQPYAKTNKELTDEINMHTYSVTEHIVGTWKTGETLYEKTIDLGSLPNAAIKQLSPGITNLKKIYSIAGAAVRSSDNTTFPLPYISLSAASSIAIYIMNGNLCVETGADRSAFDGWITLRYTKTS